MNSISSMHHTKLEVMKLTRKKNSFKTSADKVELMSKRVGVTEQNQNQQHNTIKQAQGPNTKK
jgi:hypothetical protein